jgi:hypothetical protein
MVSIGLLALRCSWKAALSFLNHRLGLLVDYIRAGHSLIRIMAQGLGTFLGFYGTVWQVTMVVNVL